MQVHVSRFELLLPFHVFLASHESRLTVTKPGLEVRFGAPQFLRTWRGPNHPRPRAACSAKIQAECLFNMISSRVCSSKTRCVPWTAFLDTDREDATHTKLIHAGSNTVTMAT